VLSPRSAPKLIQQMAKEQPIVLAYMLLVDDDGFNQDEGDLLLCLGVVVWQAMSQGARPLPRVTEQILNNPEARNVEMAGYLPGGTEDGFVQATRTIINNHGQPGVLRYVIEALMEEPEERRLIRDESKGIMLLDPKTGDRLS